VSHIFLTHAHIDHIGAVAELQRRFKAQVVLDERELPLLENAGRQAEMFGLPAPESFVPDQYAQDNSLFSFAGETVQVLCTPGHSPGGLSFLAGDRVFTGDALFYDSIGRTDLHGGSAMVLLHSIQTRLFILPGHTQVFPGHGPATTIDRERRCNPFF
jgi:glyoxylase-like metal-dependent hydrolase (beta-lactamase superfamily II)